MGTQRFPEKKSKRGGQLRAAELVVTNGRCDTGNDTDKRVVNLGEGQRSFFCAHHSGNNSAVKYCGDSQECNQTCKTCRTVLVL